MGTNRRKWLALGLLSTVQFMVVLDIAWRIEPHVRVFTLDTGRLPQETYDMMDRVREHYGVNLEVLFPDAAEQPVQLLFTQR